MTKYTDAYVDAVVVAMFNAATEFTGSPRVQQIEHVASIGNPTKWRAMARAALEAREALFDVVGDRLEVQDGEGFCYPHADRESAFCERNEMREGGLEHARVVRVTTKRRKARAGS